MSFIARIASRAAQRSTSGGGLVRIETEIRTTSFVQKLLNLGVGGNVPLSLVREASEDVAKEWKRLAIKNASAGKGRHTLTSRSGGLVNSIRYRSKNTEKGKEFQLQFHWIGSVHETGMVITPRRAKYLVFYIPGVGWRRSRRVVIPSRPWASQALKEARRQFPEFVQKRLREEIRKGSTSVRLG